MEFHAATSYSFCSYKHAAIPFCVFENLNTPPLGGQKFSQSSAPDMYSLILVNIKLCSNSRYIFSLPACLVL